jgi:hypothetical protein
MMSFIICIFAKYYWGDQIKEGKMGGTCSTHGEVRSAFRILVGKHEEYFRDPGVDGAIISKSISKIQDVRAWTAFMWLRMGNSGVL